MSGRRRGRYTRRELLGMGAASLCLACLDGLPFPDFGPEHCRADSAFIRPARHWTPMGGGTVRCGLCPNECVMADGDRGLCRVRENRKGTLYTLVYSRLAAIHVDPIEKKPFYHFLPGATAYSVATAGCNLHCTFCQNWEISQSFPEQIDASAMPPETFAERAKQASARVAAFTYNEPTVQFEYILDAAAAARRKGVRSVIVSNGYINPAPGRELAQCLDAVKIDLKAFTQKFYSDICGGNLAGVQKNLVAVKKSGRWLEIVVLVIPSLNDSAAEIRSMTRWVRENLGTDVPMHFTRFRSIYLMKNLPPTPVTTLERCREIARAEGIRYPYVGNIPGHRWENTFCHGCGKPVINRSGFMHVETMLKGGACPRCGTRVPGVWS